MSSSNQLSAEERKQRALDRIKAGGVERETRLGALQVPTPTPTPVPAPPPPPVDAAVIPPQLRSRTPPARADEPEIEPPSDVPESFGIQESRKGLRVK